MQYNFGHFGLLNTDDMADQPLILMDGGIESRFRENYDFFNEKRDTYRGYLFQYTLSGKGWFEKNGNRYCVSEGVGFLTKIPEKTRYYLDKDSAEPWTFLYLHFDGNTAAPFFQKLDALCGCVFSLDPNSHPITQYLKLHHKLICGDRLEKYEGQEFLYLFLCRLLREIEHSAARVQNSVVNLALQIMLKEYNTLEGVDEVAKRLGISQEHLTRSFKTEQGIPPVRYLTNLRIQAAMNDLLDTEDLIHDIALRTGFSNGNYFAKVFRKYAGMSPGEYRAHCIL